MEWLVIMAALFAYAVFSVIVVVTVALIAGKKGRSALKWGIGAAVVMYYLVFWDLIPTWVVYKYYCATKAGFWVYKTPEQWKAENPGGAETLTWRDMSPNYKPPGVTRGYRLNERIAWVIKETEAPIVPVGLSIDLVIDVKNNETLIRRVSVWTSVLGLGLSGFLINLESYIPNNNELGTYISNFKKLGGKKID